MTKRGPKAEARRMEANRKPNAFAALGVPRELADVVGRLGFEEPSPIQKAAIPPILGGRDGIVQSQSGTGKTSMLSLICTAVAMGRDSLDTGVRAVIVSPSRELAIQTGEMIDRMGFEPLAAAQVCSGTPGRLFQLLRLNPELFNKTRVLVVDEVDEILSTGFNQILLSIKDRLPADVNVCVTSATLTPDANEICEKITRDPIKIYTKNEDLARSGIKQFYVKVPVSQLEEKVALCTEIYKRVASLQTIIFANKISTVQALYRRFKSKGVTVGMMHREVSQKDRDRVLAAFKAQKLKLLITTDVWSRGIDVKSVMATINFEMPYQLETYMHRVGRAGRFYGKGLAVTLVSPEDQGVFPAASEDI
eukprot:CAMPEP_0114492584 /NCGR_PEP_ID=MMETSP0109-20121206/3636_1 /TAXON_ID=29199 /ORGANISM="Chlorarachnion reptans, Strain CCCM449" /LENGTH=363 /DNA_ID=CAMNT_0001669443 /DNA_START=99 /DNA_END=1189 /DNA_ORIENTATION=+